MQAASVATFMLITTPCVTWFSTPLYNPSVFSRTMIKSMPLNRVETPSRLRTGRTAAYRFSRLRRLTLIDVNPSPTGVVQGPFNARPCR